MRTRAKWNDLSTPGSRSVEDIRRLMRRRYPAQEKFRIVLDGVQGEDSVQSYVGAKA
jgi:hypothetical protein